MIKRKDRLVIDKRKLFLATAIFVSVILVLAIVALVWLNIYAEKVYPGVYLDGQNIGNKEFVEVEKILSNYEKELSLNGIVFETPKVLGQEKSYKIYPNLISADPDLSRQLIKINTQQTLNEIKGIGRGSDLKSNIAEIFNVWCNRKGVEIDFEIAEDDLIRILKEKFGEYEKDYGKTRVVLNENEELEFIEGYDGYRFDYKMAIEDLSSKILKLETGKIKLELVVENSDVTIDDARHLTPHVERLIGLLPLTLIYQDMSWEISRDEMIEWFEFETEDNQVRLAINQDKAIEHLDEIALEIDREPQEPKAEFGESRAVVFQAPRNGLALNKELTLEKIEEDFVYGDSSEIELVVSATQPQTSLEGSNSLGIRELVGVGESNFSGSPANRRHNIATGASAINGLLIAPGDEFSTIEALGEINASTGYLPELVIKEGRTIPEYGGGLCQIGTTIFRTAINAGLPITERRPHSYRVGYYEPAGTDATIYQPHPDLRFVNDTPNYLLWQTRVVGNNLIFELWGTDDGRVVEVSDPVIYNISYPGPAKEIETTELAPGERKKVESAHNGADAYFTRKITYPDSGKDPVDETFESHYVAWRETWLVGVTAETEEAIESSSADSTSGEVIYDNPFTPENESLGETAE